MFQRKYTRENNIFDLSLLPPCKDTFTRHIKRENTIAYIWNNSQQSIVEMTDISACGWTDSVDIDQINVPFPEDISDLLINNLEGIDDIYGNDEIQNIYNIFIIVRICQDFCIYFVWLLAILPILYFAICYLATQLITDITQAVFVFLQLHVCLFFDKQISCKVLRLRFGSKVFKLLLHRKNAFTLKSILNL